MGEEKEEIKPLTIPIIDEGGNRFLLLFSTTVIPISKGHNVSAVSLTNGTLHYLMDAGDHSLMQMVPVQAKLLDGEDLTAALYKAADGFAQQLPVYLEKAGVHPKDRVVHGCDCKEDESCSICR